jgi:hypothetical protein
MTEKREHGERSEDIRDREDRRESGYGKEREDRKWRELVEERFVFNNHIVFLYLK